MPPPRAAAPTPARVAGLHFVVMSLGTPERQSFVDANRRVLPELRVLQSVNGYSKRDTVGALAETPLKYHQGKYGGFKTYGTYGSLANWLTKYRALKWQLKNKVPYMAMLEDDMKLTDEFAPFVHKQARAPRAGAHALSSTHLHHRSPRRWPITSSPHTPGPARRRRKVLGPIKDPPPRRGPTCWCWARGAKGTCHRSRRRVAWSMRLMNRRRWSGSRVAGSYE